YASTIKDYKAGDIVKGKVVSTGRDILVDIDYKSEGIIEADDIQNGSKIKIGDIIEVYILKLENKDGHPVLSKSIADLERAWKMAYESYKQKDTLEAKVVSAVKGGLVVDYWGIRGFIPASQVLKNQDEELSSFIDQEIPVRVIEVDRRRKKIVFSHKLAAISEINESTQHLWKEIEAGQVRKGVVSSIKKFGVFVDLGGIEGLVHVSELSWKRIDNPSSFLKMGDKVEVFVLSVDPEKKKISLGMKQLQPDPWVGVEDRYTAGQLVTGKIVRLTTFGAFIELEEGLEGLIHISELSDNKIDNPEEVVKAGDLVQARVLRVDASSQRIGLSIKSTLPTTEDEEYSKYKEETERNRKEVTIGDIMDNNGEQIA
ncbi:30S ribosomal protein S1, partial [Candidatus Margulisiibacteriota bacterium]